jgi:NlpC/P60 family
MSVPTNSLLAIVFCGIAVVSSAQDSAPLNRSSGIAGESARANHSDKAARLSLDDRLSIIAAALDRRARQYYEHDCSHLVHAIYERAGFSYPYAPSLDLYQGIEPFQQVRHPEPGDLVVWRGHVGIVIRPSQHIFFSLLHSGPGVDDYEASYWKSLGRARFYEYIKTCSGCRSRQSWSR